jgi:hypothetical protein
LVLPWNAIPIGLRDGSEGGVPEACSAAAICDVEIRRVRDIEALGAEQQLYTFLDRRVLEEEKVDMAEVWPKL